MNIAIFDPFCGVSGNMVMGALIDAGVNPESLRNALSGLDLGEWNISVEKTARAGLACTYVSVDAPHTTTPRHLAEIMELLSNSDLPEQVAQQSKTAFQYLADAESTAHGIPPEEVHFHETGAVDAIIDIAGSFCCLHLLNIERVYSTPVATGTGTLMCEHGTLPIPAPATANLLKGIPTAPSGLTSELATPTGMAILRSAVHSWEAPPPFIPSATGAGAGTRELSRPNFLRVTLGSTSSRGKWLSDTCMEIRVILDDMDMRTWPDAAELILKAGAFECYSGICIGRKGRPALEVTVLCPPDSKDAVTESIFLNSPTFGMRISSVSRAILHREFRNVETEFGIISVKIGILDGRPHRLEPEYSDCLRASHLHDVPVETVIRAAKRASDLTLRESS